MNRMPTRLALAAALACLSLPALAQEDLRKELAAQRARLEQLEKRLAEAEAAKAQADAAKAQADAEARAKSAAAPAVSGKKGLTMPAGLSIYGIADAGIEAGSYGQGKKLRFQSGLGSASRLGFKGERSFTEDLSAYFQLEMGISFDNGQNSGHSSNVSNPGAGANSAAAPNTTGVAIFSRNTFVGLNSQSMGDVRVGRDYAPIYSITSASDPFTIGGATAFRLWSSAAASRFDNAIFYASPSLEGFKVNVAYSAGMENNSRADVGVTGGALGNSSSTGPANEGKGYSASFTYNKGPLFLAAGLLDYAKMGTVAAPATDSQHRKSWNLAATYELDGGIKLYGQFLHGKESQDGGVAPNALNRDIWWIGAAGPIAKGHTWRAVVSRLDDRSPLNRDSTHIGLGYEYALDKQTDLYLYYAQVTNQNGGQNSLCAGGTCQGYDKDSGLPANYTPRSLMTGARYRF